VAAGVRRAVREGIQAESRERLRALGLAELELPLVIGGASTPEAVRALSERFLASWRAA
jgi:hypothetical protein